MIIIFIFNFPHQSNGSDLVLMCVSQDWSYVQSLAGRVGRDSLMHQVRDFDTAKVEQRTATRVREILGYHDLDEVRVASNGAATFHVWVSCDDDISILQSYILYIYIRTYNQLLGRIKTILLGLC